MTTPPPYGFESYGFEPSTHNPQTVVLVAAGLRHILTILSGLGISVGFYSDSALMSIASGLVGTAVIAWSLWQKYQAARKDHAGSVRSAQIGQPEKAI